MTMELHPVAPLSTGTESEYEVSRAVWLSLRSSQMWRRARRKGACKGQLARTRISHGFSRLALFPVLGVIRSRRFMLGEDCGPRDQSDFSGHNPRTI